MVPSTSPPSCSASRSGRRRRARRWAAIAIVFETDDASFASTLELSRTVPVVVVLWASWSEQSSTLVATLDRLVRARDGRLVLAAADADRSPQLVQAFQAQSIPTVVAVIAGQPVPLFAGVQPDDVIEQVFDQLLELGAQHGVTGRVEADGEQAPADGQARARRGAAAAAAPGGVRRDRAR